MARFKLNPNSSAKTLGTEIFNLGADYYKLVRTPSQLDIGAILELKQNDIVEDMFNFEDELRNIGGPPEVQFHYDGQEPNTGKYVLHIVVPDMEGKRVDAIRFQEAEVDPDLDLTDFATECMGELVMRGCGK